MGKKIQYYLSKEYHSSSLYNIHEQINDFLSKQGISSSIKGGIFRNSRVEGTTRNNTAAATYGNLDLEVSVWVHGFTWGNLCFNVEFDKANDSLEQRKKVEGLVGLLTRFNPEDIKTGNTKRTNKLMKQYKNKNFFGDDRLLLGVKEYLRQHDIPARDEKGIIQGICGDIGIKVYMNTSKSGFRWTYLNFDVEFDDSLEERKKADDLIALLASYNPKNI